VVLKNRPTQQALPLDAKALRASLKEFVGEIERSELIRTFDPGAVSGRLIFIPAINLPAVAAARRTSPLDDIKFNRAFHGDPFGSPTQQIVAYVNNILFPMADAFLDLHSGRCSPVRLDARSSKSHTGAGFGG
jgi:N-alpha-acetyl-L-2,4-diaminobutyrate deacetylase